MFGLNKYVTRVEITLFVYILLFFSYKNTRMCEHCFVKDKIFKYITIVDKLKFFINCNKFKTFCEKRVVFKTCVIFCYIRILYKKHLIH